MIKNTMNLLTLKEIETDLFRTLQITYSEAFSHFLTELDQILAQNRNKTRFQLKDKRKMTMDSLFGSIEVNRNYYYDRESKKASARNGNQHGHVFIMRNDCILYEKIQKNFII